MGKKNVGWVAFAAFLAVTATAAGQSQEGFGGTGLLMAQAGFPGGGFPGGGFPGGGFPGGGLPGGSPGNLAQQPGLLPGGRGSGLAPGATLQLALYCADLFARTPDHRSRLVTNGDEGWVRQIDGSVVKLREALDADLVQIRGRGPVDPPRRDQRASFDVFVTNLGQQPIWLELPAGLVLVPAGQRAPELPAGFRRALVSASATPRLEGETPAYAVWATRGFTRADVEQTLMRRVTEPEVSQVQRWLDFAAVPQRFDRESAIYDQLYRAAAARLSHGSDFTGAASLSTGARVRVEGRRNRDGHAVVTLLPTKGNASWRYAARVDGARPGKISLTLQHLKTGLPLEANGGRIWVTLTP